MTKTLALPAVDTQSLNNRLLLILLLMTMIKKDALASVGSYFYLVAPLVAIQAWFLFEERIGLSALAGVVLISFGVAITTSKKSIRNLQS